MRVVVPSEAMMAGTSRQTQPALWFLWLAPAILLVEASACRAWDEAIESVMYRSPDLPKPRVVKIFPEQTEALWLEALRRPEAHYQCQAAVTIILAHQRGIKGLERAVLPLVESVDRPDQHATVRLAAARALLELNAREAAPRLFRQAQCTNGELRDLIEAGLVRWEYQPARAVWLERLGQADHSPDGLLLAIQGLAAVREEKAIPGLRHLTLSSHVAAPIRLEAARALGVLRTSGSEEDARHLTADGSPSGVVARLAAAFLLRHHEGDEGIRLLQGLARDAEPGVAVVALARLIEIDSKLVVPVVEQLLAGYDPNVRSFAIEVLFKQPTAEHIRLLADRLNDPDPQVRIKARRSLRELADKPEFREPVIGQAERVLAGANWRGLEQSLILLSQLDHKPAARRMVELLKCERPEVLVAAAWGLRRLGVADTLPAALQHFLHMTEPQVGVNPPHDPRALSPEAIDQQLSQLAQFFGQSRYGAADVSLRQMIPRPGDGANLRVPAGIQNRAAAIWALGIIHEGNPVPEITQSLEERLSDLGGIGRPPEDYRVRWMSAITLGRMIAKEKIATLRRFYSARKPSLDPVNNACGWAIEQLTGEIMPPAGTVQVRETSFKNWLRSLEPESAPGR